MKSNSDNVKIIDARCVNSKWIASWLAGEGQECCECMVSCKVKVLYKGYPYVMTEEEYNKLKQEHNRNQKDKRSVATTDSQS